MDFSRLISFCIDQTILAIIVSIVNRVLKLDFELGNTYIISFGFTLKYSLLMFCYFVYLTLFDILNKGQTPGKFLMSLKVVDGLGVLTVPSLLKRSFLTCISVMLLPMSMLLYVFNNEFLLQDRYTRLAVVKR